MFSIKVGDASQARRALSRVMRSGAFRRPAESLTPRFLLRCLRLLGRARWMIESYGDTALAGARAATICGISFFTPDRVLFASDCPFDPEKGRGYIRATIEVIESLDLTTDEREKICHRNAETLFDLAPS